MLNNINNIFRNILSKHHKITLLLSTILLFTIIYLTLDDINFSGVNKFQEIVRDEIVKKEVEPKVNEIINESFLSRNFNTRENFNNIEYFDQKTILEEEKKKQVIDETTDDTKIAVEEQELDPEQIKPSIFQQLFNRFYFSVITGCLLGYGDIYPVTNISKSCSLLQSLITVILILY